jgi:hypothetical protein
LMPPNLNVRDTIGEKIEEIVKDERERKENG